MEYVSVGGAKLTGYPPNDIINNSKRSYDSLIHYDDHDMVWAAVQSGVRERRKFDIVYRIFTRGNELKWVWERGTGVFSDDGELLGLEGYITDITADKIAQDKLLDSQLYDPLTRLPNRHLLMDRLGRALARTHISPDSSFILMLLHFDQLADFFARYDTDFQSAVSSEIAHRLNSEISGIDSISVLQADRYAILIDLYPGRELNARTLAERIFSNTRAPLNVEEKTHYLTCSIGAVLSATRHRSADSVIQDAAVALDRARELGVSRFEMFDSEGNG